MVDTLAEEKHNEEKMDAEITVQQAEAEAEATTTQAKVSEDKYGPMAVTAEGMREKIEKVAFVIDPEQLGTLTICAIQMKNGFQVVGKSACVSADKYDEAFGKKLAFDDAFRQLWALEGYALAEQRHHTKELIG